MKVLLIGTGLIASAICKLYKLGGANGKFNLVLASKSRKSKN